MGDIRGRPVAVLGALLIDEFFDYASIGNNNCRPCAQFQRVETSILLGPFGKSSFEGQA